MRGEVFVTVLKKGGVVSFKMNNCQQLLKILSSTY